MLLVNPRQTALWQSHVILNGRGHDYFVPNFPGPLSVKSVISGTAAWETDEGRFELRPGSCLVLNDRQPYSITIESKTVVETLCIFFSQGFVEDVARATTKGDAELLADPWKEHTIEFHERLHADDGIVMPLLQKLHRTNDEELIWQLAEALVKRETATHARAEKLPAVKRSTREELWRRIQRGRNVMEGALDQALDLSKVAREAALSPYHFHRSFTQIFRETPSAYLMRRRMERAAGLLTSTDKPVTEVCLACGYQSLGSFSSLFRRHTGIPPSEFRRKKISKI